MKKKKVVQCFTLDQDVAKHLAEFAAINRVSKSAALNLILAAHRAKVRGLDESLLAEARISADELDKLIEERAEDRRLEEKTMRELEEREALSEATERRRKYGSEG